MKNVDFIPTNGPLGAEVRGVDLSEEQPGDVVFSILRAFARYQVLIFRDQDLDLDRQLEVAEWFGPRYDPPRDQPLCEDATAPVSMVSNVVPNGILGYGELTCHSDLPYMPLPALGSALYALEVPSMGGDTSWSNLYQAYDDLDEQLKAKLPGLMVCAVNPMSGRLRRGGTNHSYSDYDFPRFPHPVVRTHPETGRKSLFVSYTSFELIGLDDLDEARDLLHALQRHVDQDYLYYRHQWRAGDLVIWDNRCTNHKRTAFDASERRVMRRVVMAGTVPF
jgi:taurine dioxygenase